jgi:hypothetical protein
MILHHYNTAFPLKTAYKSKIRKNRWITQGIRNSKRMRLLNGLKKQQNLSSDMVEYITRYRIIYKRVIKEAKKLANDKYVSRAQNKMKAMWNLINEEVGKPLKGDKKIELSSGTKIISDPQSVADMLNNFCC